MQLRGLSASIELCDVLEVARELSDGSHEPLDSVHLLLALFTVNSRARAILEERGVREETLLDSRPEVGAEPVDAIPVIHYKTAEIAAACNAEVIGSLHFLIGLCRVRSCRAYQLLVRAGARPPELRATAFAYLNRKARNPDLLTATPHADRVTPVEEDLRSPSGSRVRRAMATAEIRLDDMPASAAARPRPALTPEELVAESGDPERSRFALDAEIFPTLVKLGRNLTLLAEMGQLDPLIGCEHELDQLVDILNKRKVNNPCLVGGPGVGKTAIVEGLAQRIVTGGDTVGALGEKVLVELQMSRLLAGTQFRGAFAERLEAIKDEVKSAEGRIVLFIDEIHTLVGAGAGGDGPMDGANALKTALAMGDFPCRSSGGWSRSTPAITGWSIGRRRWRRP